MNSNTWSDVLDNSATAIEIYRQFAAERDGRTIGEWMEAKSVELWGDEHDVDANYTALGDELREDAAKQRVVGDEALDAQFDTIFDDDWANDGTHLDWVCTASVDEIVSWAQTVQQQAEEAVE